VAGATAGVAPVFLRSRADAQDFQLKAADPAAKPGGTLRFGILNAPAHFDVHQSGTIANLGPQAPMYDLLIRRDPRDGNTIIPDLAYKWEVAPDGKKYTFHLRKGVKFHDGAEMTSADMKATYERIVRPPKGVVIPRSSLFTAVGDIVTPDPYTIEFRLTEPRPRAFMLGSFASGWNIVVRKKTLDDNQGNLRQVMNFPAPAPSATCRGRTRRSGSRSGIPTTGTRAAVPRPARDLQPAAVLPELGSSFLSGKVDYARIMDPVSWRKAKRCPASPRPR